MTDENDRLAVLTAKQNRRSTTGQIISQLYSATGNQISQETVRIRLRQTELPEKLFRVSHLREFTIVPVFNGDIRITNGPKTNVPISSSKMTAYQYLF